MRCPFVILVGQPTPSVVAFADTLARMLPDKVLIVADSKSEEHPELAELIYVSDDECRQSGFVNSSHLIKKTPIAWDKALFVIATRQNIEFDHVWFVEDDVLFAKPELAVELIQKYSNSSADLLLENFFSYDEQPQWDHWETANHFGPSERAAGFLPLARMSRTLLDHCHAYVRQHGSLSFIETLFPSLVVRHGLKVEKLHFLTERTFRWAPPFKKMELYLKLDDSLESGIFHPVKSDQLRSLVASSAKRFKWSRPSTWDVLVRH